MVMCASRVLSILLGSGALPPGIAAVDVGLSSISRARVEVSNDRE